MQKFGMVIAIGQELGGVLQVFGDVIEKRDGAFPVYKVMRGDAEIYVAASGIGEIASAAAAQYLISEYKVEVLMNFGFVGSLAADIACQEIVVVKDVVHYEIDTSLIDGIEIGRYLDYPSVEIPLDKGLIQKVLNDFPNIKTVRLASGDKFVATTAKKLWLIDTYNAEICDMEGAGIVLTANRNKVPALLIKIVSDNADENSPVSFEDIAKKGTSDCARILTDIVDKLVK